MTEPKSSGQSQSLAVDEFLYFFVQIRKHRIRTVVQGLQQRFPDETPAQLARRLIASHAELSFLGGSLLHVPMLLPGIGHVLKLLGFVTGAAALTRMHLYLILEIALLYGRDIDDAARVPEMMAVVAATGLAVSAPLLSEVLSVTPLIAIPAAGLTATALTQMIGNAAIELYSRMPADSLAGAPSPA
jgi:hypothetical protein